MRRSGFVIGIVVLLFIVSSCNTTNAIDQAQLDAYQIEQSSDKIETDDFIFRLVSQKEEYAAGEEVQLYGELIYIGEKEEIEIAQGGSTISFIIEEKVRHYGIGSITNDMMIYRNIKRNEENRVKYTKNTFFMEGEDEEYDAFMKQFLNEEGFPPGYYVVKGTTEFTYYAGNDGREKVQLELQVDFKVNNR